MFQSRNVVIKKMFGMIIVQNYELLLVFIEKKVKMTDAI